MVIEELKSMGESWMINDPCLARCYKQWLYKNAEAISMSLVLEPDREKALINYRGMVHSLN